TPCLSGGGEALLRTLEVGVCGTDREICAFEYGAPPTGEADLVLGHEAVAEAGEGGPDVAWGPPGGLVVPTGRLPRPGPRCRRGRAWRDGRRDFCAAGQFRERGLVGAHGFLCDAFVEEERFLVPVPLPIRDVAVLVEPLSVAAKAVQEFESLRARFRFDVPHP